jgi:hypothetical protein
MGDSDGVVKVAAVQAVSVFLTARVRRRRLAR